jgi:hypothetical protein
MAEKDRLLIHPIHTKYATILQFLDDSPKMRNLVGDIKHISLFVESHMGEKNEGFYTNTLWHNLSEGEKFMFELFGTYYPSLQIASHENLNAYSKLKFPDFTPFVLPVIHLEGIEIEEEEILKISSDSSIVEVKYFTYKDFGKTVSLFDRAVLSPASNQLEWYLDLSKIDIEPYKIDDEWVEPSVGIAVQLQFQEQPYLFLAEVSFEMEPEDGDWEISQNGWKPLSHRLAKQLSKMI